MKTKNLRLYTNVKPYAYRVSKQTATNMETTLKYKPKTKK